MMVGTRIIREVNTISNSMVNGNGAISGVVSIGGKPVDIAVVLLICERTVPVSCTSTRAGGAYRFDYLDMRLKYTVIAFDAESKLNAVLSDNISPEPMS